ncbi:MAG: oxygen-independent coproporphyrinogen III oxidase [Povalibacter sp.]
MDADTLFDSELIRRYDASGPRYTSYPTAAQFHSGFDAQAYRAAALLSNAEQSPLSIYVHVPFCASPCFYCGCNRVITRDPLHAERYLNALCTEIELQGRLVHTHRRVEQLHFGGGTPTFLSMLQIGRIMRTLRREFVMADDEKHEYSIEIDPRTVDTGTIERLQKLGFNRISLGVQDFDPNVQAAVNRVQSVAQTREIVEQARRSGIQQINFDLIYGLPRQTTATFAVTLDQVIAIRPTRIAAYGYAHLPRIFKAQRQIDAQELPSAAERLALLELTVERLSAAGYVYIGMDHFALPEDSLTQALTAGSLHRNFQGYSSHADCDLVGLGVSAIGRIGDAYAQNAKDLRDYYASLEHHQLAIRKGYKLTIDDRIRRDVIQQLMCAGHVDFQQIESDHCIEFTSYFARELSTLDAMREDGLIASTASDLRVTPRGRFLVRNIAMVFDAHLQMQQASGFSKVI